MRKVKYIFIALILISLCGCVVVPGCIDTKGKVENMPENTTSFIFAPGHAITIYDVKEPFSYEIYSNNYGFIHGISYLYDKKAIMICEVKFRALNDYGEYDITKREDEKNYLKLLSINAGTVEVLYEGLCERPAVSPDEKKAVFYSNGNLVIIDINAKKTNILSTEATSSIGYKMPPSWSPDAKKIAFVTNDGYVAIISASGGKIEKIRKGVSCQWSPVDNEKILISEYPWGPSYKYKDSNYYVINTKGAILDNLTDTFKDEFSYPWSYYWAKDGVHIFVVSRHETLYGGNYMRVWQLNIKTKEVKRIIKDYLFSADLIQIRANKKIETEK